jgi:GNAT superfamily N-acetyltransferase
LADPVPVAERIAAAHADTADLAAVGGEWGVVAGVPCEHLPLPHPWATSGRVLALGTAPTPAILAEVTAWLAARSPQWTVMVRAEHAAGLTGLRPWGELPVLRLAGPPPRPTPPPGVRIETTVDAAAFLTAYGVDQAPQLTPAHLASPYRHHLVARLDGDVVGCARVLLLGDTACVNAVTVPEPYRRRGIGAALTAQACQLGRDHTDLVWLHCTEASRPLYERLGFRHADDHLQLQPPARQPSQA